MHDGNTRRLSSSDVERTRFLLRNKPVLIVLDGPEAGSEFALTSARRTLGRGPGVDIAIQDDLMSQEHAAFELGDDGYRVLDLDSTNGLSVNGRTVAGADLKDGDQIRLGGHTLQYVLETTESVQTFEL